MPELKRGYQGPLYSPWYDWASNYAKSYAFLLGKKDGYYGADEEAFTKEMQRRLGIVQDGVFGDRTAALVGYRWPGGTPTPVVRRPIWFYSCPGSGADWNVGPSFVVGEMVAGKQWNHPGRESLRINHQPVGFVKGGYLGLLGGDPKFSYIDVITDQKHALQRLLRDNPDVKVALAARGNNSAAQVDVELWFSGYSQSADGLLEAIKELFGDGGEFAAIRDRINGLIVFGNPATAVTGIARKTFPDWVNTLTRNINTSNDFYAVAKDDIRPLFYEWFIKAETELPFVVYSAQIILPAIARLMKDLGPLTGPFFPLLLAGATGMSAFLPLLSMMVGGVTGATSKPNPELVELLSVRGILTNLDDLMKLLIALPGLQSHGAYHLPRAEFGGRDGHMVAYDLIANYRR